MKIRLRKRSLIRKFSIVVVLITAGLLATTAVFAWQSHVVKSNVSMQAIDLFGELRLYSPDATTPPVIEMWRVADESETTAIFDGAIIDPNISPMPEPTGIDGSYDPEPNECIQHNLFAGALDDWTVGAGNHRVIQYDPASAAFQKYDATGDPFALTPFDVENDNLATGDVFITRFVFRNSSKIDVYGRFRFEDAVPHLNISDAKNTRVAYSVQLVPLGDTAAEPAVCKYFYHLTAARTQDPLTGEWKAKPPQPEGWFYCVEPLKKETEYIVWIIGYVVDASPSDPSRLGFPSFDLIQTNAVHADDGWDAPDDLFLP